MGGVLSWFQQLFWQQSMELTLVGLHSSGKTTLVNVMSGNEFTIDQIPTVGFNMKKMQRGNVTIKVCLIFSLFLFSFLPILIFF